MDGDPKSHLSPSLINRAFLLDRQLRSSGIGMFLYSPAEVSTLEAVPGYTIEGDELEVVSLPVPQFNANWTYGTRRLIDKGMGYRRFKKWVQKNDIEVNVPYEFSELVSDKRKTYEVVEECIPSLHPHTEDFIASSAQIESFLDRADIVFLKPRAGNRGNQIFVIRKQSDGLSLKYYDQGNQRLFSPVSLEAAMSVVDAAAGDKNYIIQEGVESVRFEGAVFDVRVVMVNDGKKWHSIIETRLAPQDSDLSNIYQGGSIRVAEDLLAELFGSEAALRVEAELRRLSQVVSEHLDSRFPKGLIEIGLDFVLDAEEGIHLVEVNAKPGIAGFGSETPIFDWKAEDQPYYDKWVHPHMRHLAEFLKSKVEA
jgi:glutathione synthase/RimK-type ligase-like ATP-grasp enzyme